MKIGIILNGISRKKNFFYNSIYPILQQHFNVEIFETQHAQHAIELASHVAKEKYDCIFAAGGDGTLNQVLNGILLNPPSTITLPTLGIIPLGTGNDFAKMCGIKPDAIHISTLIKKNTPQLTDIGKLNCLDESGETVIRYFINVCSIGMGPEVVRRLSKNNRALGPTITYLKAITETFFTHKPQKVFVNTPNWEWQGKMRVLAIANGKSFGNSMFIAPDALPDDGLFSTFLAKDMALLKFLMFLQLVKAKKKITNSSIMYNTSTTIGMIAPEPCPIEAEGEWMGWLPAKIEMLPKHINFLR